MQRMGLSEKQLKNNFIKVKGTYLYLKHLPNAQHIAGV